MIRQKHAASREFLIANAIQPVVSELRLVDVADYVAFLRLEHFSAIADIVDSAAELYFMPGTLRMGHGGEAHVGWTKTPRISLDLELRPSGATVYFTLTLSALHASVEVNYVAFDQPNPDPERNTAFLEAAVGNARMRTREAVGL